MRKLAFIAFVVLMSAAASARAEDVRGLLGELIKLCDLVKDGAAAAEDMTDSTRRILTACKALPGASAGAEDQSRNKTSEEKDAASITNEICVAVSNVKAQCAPVNEEGAYPNLSKGADCRNSIDGLSSACLSINRK